MPQEYICESVADLPKIAKALLDKYPNTKVFALHAGMGAGKTTFVKAIAKMLGITEIVTSPTFSIVNSYKNNTISVYHFDFYRIKDIREAYDIGYEEYFYSGHYCFVEWPELIESLMPDDTVEVTITVNELTGFRIFAF